MKNNVIGIDEAYEKLLNSGGKLTDEDIEEINETLESEYTDPDMEEAKELAANSDLKDTEFIGKSVINSDNGSAIMTEEVDMENIPSFSELLEEYDIDKTKLPDAEDLLNDQNTARLCIAEFFGREKSEESYELNGLTDEVIDDFLKVTERYKESVITGKKFSYYISMPDPIKSMITEYMGMNNIRFTGANANKAARNECTKALLCHYLNRDRTELFTIYLSESVLKMQEELDELQDKSTKELASSKEWADASWKVFEHSIPNMITKLEEKGWNGEANKYRKVLAAYKETCIFKLLINDIKSGLKVRHIDLEEFEKYCETFNSNYENSKFAINDVYQTFVTLCKCNHFNEDEMVYKKFIAYFIAYCKKHNFDTENIIDHTYMYYFIMNIILMDFYNPDDEEDKKFHTNYWRSLQNVLNVVKSTMDLEEEVTE